MSSAPGSVPSAPILVTGANGRTGRAVVAALHRLGANVRAFIRDAAQAPALAALGADGCALGDLADAGSLGRALVGCGAVVHIGPPMHADEVKITQALLAQAREAGVARVIYYSVMHPLRREVAHHARKLDAEEAVIESGLPYTILQPIRYMQHLEPIWPMVRAQGVHAMPFGTAARFSVVDLADLAEATALVATSPGHLYASYELAGPQALSSDDMAAILAEALGRDVRAVATPLAEMEAAARARGVPEARIAVMRAMNAHYDRFGFLGNPNVLSWLLGRQPGDFRAYVQRLLAA